MIPNDILVCTHSASYAQNALKHRTATFDHATLRGTFKDGATFQIAELRTMADLDRFKGRHFVAMEVVGDPLPQAVDIIRVQVRP